MIVCDFNLLGASIAPHETDTPLIIDADAVLARAAAFECPETVPWRRRQIRKLLRFMYLAQLTLCRPLDVRPEPPREPTMKQSLGIAISNGTDHASTYTRSAL